MEPCTDKRITRMVYDMSVGYSKRTACPECGIERCALVSRKSVQNGYVHCFRDTCGYSAVVNLDLSMQQLAQAQADRALANSHELNFELPRDACCANSFLNGQPNLNELWCWLAKASLRPEDVQNWVMWSESMRCAVIPCMEQGYLQGVLYRPLPSRRGVPKYILKHRRERGALWAPASRFPRKKDIVLVEDVLSCIRLFRLGVPAVATLGTYCNDSIMSHLLSLEPTSVCTFLDGDGAGRKGVQTFRRKLELHGIPNSALIVDGRDPKHLTNDQLRHYLGARALVEQGGSC